MLGLAVGCGVPPGYTGTIEIDVGDDFVVRPAQEFRGNSHRLLTDDGQTYLLSFENGKRPSLLPGQRVTVRGWEVDSETVAADGERALSVDGILRIDDGLGVAAQALSRTGTRTIAVILFNFPNVGTKPLSRNPMESPGARSRRSQVGAEAHRQRHPSVMSRSSMIVTRPRSVRKENQRPVSPWLTATQAER